ncbi:UNVERIFIED_CONTAM: hypothetical protein K2H54_048411 [Gekko kuhli]
MGNQNISPLKRLFCFRLEELVYPKFDPPEKIAYEMGSSSDVQLNSPRVPLPQLNTEECAWSSLYGKKPQTKLSYFPGVQLLGTTALWAKHQPQDSVSLLISCPSPDQHSHTNFCCSFLLYSLTVCLTLD